MCALREESTQGLQLPNFQWASLDVFQIFGIGWFDVPISKEKGLENSGTACGSFLTVS